MADAHDDPRPHSHWRGMHACAMTAKQHVFTAQDALGQAWSDYADGRRALVPKKADLTKAERLLVRVRADLEQLDNIVLRSGAPRFYKDRK